MRNLITLVLLLIINTKSFGQADSSKTEIVIIGTIHTGNKFFNHKTLSKILKKLNPDIILNEDSEKHKPVFGLKTAKFLKIAKPDIEQLALQTFSKENKNVNIFPYDTNFVSRIKYKRKINKIHSLFFNRLNAAKMSQEDSISYADYANLRNDYGEFIMRATLVEINQPDIIDIARKKYELEETVILPIARKYLDDFLLIDEFEKNLLFWNARNQFMVRQIISYINKYPKKRIVVLCGLNHKYFLNDGILGA